MVGFDWEAASGRATLYASSPWYGGHTLAVAAAETAFSSSPELVSTQPDASSACKSTVVRSVTLSVHQHTECREYVRICENIREHARICENMLRICKHMLRFWVNFHVISRIIESWF